ncbi:hypothetical protein SAMN05414137_104142 [Streptacidiphilus jiangxiensis]|uniref:Uncharacterized protein n=1 Tax=Streptacidiphilus jiangxiensis TaxID=235985 RepID=A0A1H7KP37_STRJI|nr:hypothetical protein SAMN05414137_104142 [Streptacidiphilus jiangxiensis]
MRVEKQARCHISTEAASLRRRPSTALGFRR